MGPLECLECPNECSGPFKIITVVISGIGGVKWLEGCVWITKLLLILLTLVYFFMARETAPVNMMSCVLEIIDVHSDVLVDFLVVLARVVDAASLAPP